MGYNTFGPTTSGYAAQVNNTVITLAEHQEVSNRMINFYSETLGDSFEMNNVQIQEIRLGALEQLIRETAVYQGASKEKLMVPQEMIRDQIIAFQHLVQMVILAG